MYQNSSLANISTLPEEVTLAIKQRNIQPPCQAACPAGIRIRDYIALIAQGCYLDAIKIVRERMPFPSACGRICQHPCEAECNRRLVDEPLAIMYLKRFVSDYEFQLQPPLPKPLPKIKTKKVAVIGAGPSGLSAAQDLTKTGYSVTMLEALPFAGGTLRAALPPYRIPRELLDWDIQNILCLGIDLKTNAIMGKDFSLTELKQDGYQAIFIATGVERSRKMTKAEVGIFAEGDFAPGPLWTVQAVGLGHKAAKIVDQYLKSKTAIEEQPVSIARLDQADLEKRLNEGQIKLQPRTTMPIWEGAKTNLGFLEMDTGYTEEMALKEASRCLSCGAAEIIEPKCTACLTCLRLCPYNVPFITSSSSVEIRPNLCRACGLCVAECPAKAIVFTMPGVEDIYWRIERAMEEISLAEPKIVGFYCSYRIVNTTTYAEFIRAKPANLAVVTIPCLSKINLTHLLKAFELGANGVFVAACLESNCPYQHSMFWAKQRLEAAKKILKELGLGTERLMMYNVSATETMQFKELTEFIQQLPK